ncbi:tRNA (adenosine(37)-N6)-threonylcarbamoyltransferase complex dimerization subunit type 1 TsaB [Virgibacillus profundi]|uniref:tRNA (Adenosine(37)-N6)-threonylcarbamoyltransferase complex dimerization subunit type 1 TsaB n=1 Tax=Virgibacillus profundi TaxID=2024555 RepID=A0A2A2I8N7_9BACI|nr:tRNA (adenosine(37)-N6)-threonylcarbamoyltransferase complex dimerization subunit type 1 TsaB [Virgibacillus profundi]PAV27686.1 tRNA (adenosine(37)-N6)-threonylcarbamoyltransferase complex dimerization subunit type 1 TsaB [Virgibacillus profundi]PXY51841.1 tRNA (adenosine(37)-N6)-threonylcarbamoyltransferase complex dimerization subunit type 1 TsaB [Virgibacillus profundi]
MNILAIDTSNQVLGVAILKDDQIIGEIVTNLAKNHSVRLMPAIDKLMKEVSMSPEQLDKIVVAKGPGSYTGVRIGLATAKSLAWALNIPIVGISSLEALAYQGRFFNGYICPFFDARRGMVYTGLYKWSEGKLNAVYEETNSLMEDILNKLAEEKKEVLFLSPDISIYKEAIMSNIGEFACVPDGPYHLAKPSHLALAGMERTADPTHTLTPNYLRLAEAEANWMKAQKEKQQNG